MVFAIQIYAGITVKVCGNISDLSIAILPIVPKTATAYERGSTDTKHLNKPILDVLDDLFVKSGYTKASTYLCYGKVAIGIDVGAQKVHHEGMWYGWETHHNKSAC